MTTIIAECERQQAELDLDLEHCASRCGQLALALTQPQPAHADCPPGPSNSR